MSISFENINQWNEIKSKILHGLIPCPSCDRWCDQVRKIPDRYIPFMMTRYSHQCEYACDYCIAEASDRKRRYEHRNDKPTCWGFHSRNGGTQESCLDGFVYFADCGNMQIKIGCSRSEKAIVNRVSAIKRDYKISSPKLIKHVETNCYTTLERWFHTKFNKIQRELFLLDESQYQYILDLPDFISVGKINADYLMIGVVR